MVDGRLPTEVIILLMMFLYRLDKNSTDTAGAVGNYTGTGVPTLGGSFTSPIINGYTYTFTQRALNQPEDKYDFLL